MTIVHVAVDARSLRAPLSGVGRYTLSLVRALGAHPTAPYLTCFVNRRDVWDEHAWPERCRVVVSRAEMESHPWGDLAWHRSTPALVSALDPPVTAFWGPSFQVPWGKSFPVPRLVTIHDLAAFVCPDTIPWKFVQYLKTVMRQSVRAADLVIAVSEATRRDVLRELRVPAERVRVILEGAFAPLGVAPQPPATLDPDHSFLLFVGAFEPRKNIPFLLDVFERLRATGDPRHLVMCGPPGWKNAPILERLSQSPARDVIHRLAFVSDAELAWLYRHADALLLPSRYEGFGLPPLEAASFGTPAFVSDGGALPESAFRPEFVVPLEVDAWVERLRTTPRPAADDLRAHAARFTWQAAADRFLEVVAELAAAREAAGAGAAPSSGAAGRARRDG